MGLSIKKISILFGGGLLTTLSHSGWAVQSCEFDQGTSTVSLTVPLNPGVISVGADIPVGTIIYQGAWTNTPAYMLCLIDQPPAYYNWAVSIVHAPLGLSGLNSGPFAGAVYNTNIPGIGVAISRYNNRSAAVVGTPGYRDEEIEIGDGGSFATLSSATRYVSLIKTGPLIPGNYTIEATSFPTASDDILNSRFSSPISGLPLRLNHVTFQGNLTVLTQTCTTPDVAVTVGSYEIHDYFTSINSTTPWVDASIALTNCPTFYGFYNQSNPAKMINFNTGSSTVTASTNNSIGVRLTPTTDVLDAVNGIMAIDSTIAGAATGVGIQLGWGDSSQTPTLFNLATEQSMTLPKDGSPSIRIPLAVRYIQTAVNPTPGRANGKVVFTVNYY
ncbi:P pilus assembly protein, pilin FimA [Serratia fonticola]|jgi:major type 1 subunit fimbrin (pilin)|uniref:Type 1 fimbrial protein n=1 Tax=Serratia fonticola TaxID=47917 RepID=A0AAE7JVS1_SERFO|nr:fimbrial protein [Serratia fonticola]QKJ61367.2 type 1 fimbrial protein [Serratia fonticola]CAI1658608.1 P pilus assembly protein, pilin FimA [Serratia fonticola]